jgi:DNA (cytosine-5)-methyltransferase 1
VAENIPEISSLAGLDGVFGLSDPTIQTRYRRILEDAYHIAEAVHKEGSLHAQREILGEEIFTLTSDLAKTKHAARGVALTLTAYKILEPRQDIRRHKAEHPAGFSARTIDKSVTVPFLQSRSLAYNVETHWLSQTFSFAGPYELELDLKTKPPGAGKNMIKLVNAVQSAPSPVHYAKAAIQLLLHGLIEERNRGKVLLEKPKDLAIDQVIALLRSHFYRGYEKNAPRLPQVAIYALYQCIVDSMDRYKEKTLSPLERLKTANRKSGSVGDIDVNRGDQPVEAVEVKFDVAITRDHVAEAIQKIKTVSVERYLILSTAGIADGEAAEVQRLQVSFKRSNGCEIIVNGVLETVRYYLRLIRSTTDFIFRYTTLVESDPDLSYEHRLAWNEVCASVLGTT